MKNSSTKRTAMDSIKKSNTSGNPFNFRADKESYTQLYEIAASEEYNNSTFSDLIRDAINFLHAHLSNPNTKIEDLVKREPKTKDEVSILLKIQRALAGQVEILQRIEQRFAKRYLGASKLNTLEAMEIVQCQQLNQSLGEINRLREDVLRHAIALTKVEHFDQIKIKKATSVIQDAINRGKLKPETQEAFEELAKFMNTLPPQSDAHP